MSTYEVFVSNIGTVYSGDDLADAEYDYDEYVKLSKYGQGRARAQEVILFKDGHTVDHHIPTKEE